MWDGSSGNMCLEKRANTTALKKQKVKVAHMECDPANITEQVLEELSKLVEVDLLVMDQWCAVQGTGLFSDNPQMSKVGKIIPLYCISVLYNIAPVVVF